MTNDNYMSYTNQQLVDLTFLSMANYMKSKEISSFALTNLLVKKKCIVHIVMTIGRMSITIGYAENTRQSISVC